MVPIRPNAPVNNNNNSISHYEKHKLAPGMRKVGASVATKSILKAKVEYSDSKDSGHETSSIHTDNSDNSSSCESPKNRGGGSGGQGQKVR